MLIARRLYLAGDGPRPVRAGSAWPLSLGRSVRRGSKVKRDFACTFTGHLLPVRVVLRSQSCLRLEGRTRTLSGPSPDLSPARTLAPSSRCEDLLIRRYPRGRPDPFRSVRDLARVPVVCPWKSGESRCRSSVWLPPWLPAVPDAWHISVRNRSSCIFGQAGRHLIAEAHGRQRSVVQAPRVIASGAFRLWQ